MKANPDKYHLLVKIGKEAITINKCGKLLGVKIDN